MKVGGKGPALATWSFSPRRFSLFGEPSGLVECPRKQSDFRGNGLLARKPGADHREAPGTWRWVGAVGTGGWQRRPPAEGAGTDDGGEPQRRVSVESVPTAAVCGAMGCRHTEKLLKVCRSDGETRVLCFRHALGWCL